MDFTPIEKQTKLFADARREVIDIVNTVNRKVAAIHADARRDLNLAAKKLADRRTVLATLIDGARNLFAKPKTQIFHDTKVGLRKGVGGIDWQDDATVVRLIRKHYPEQFDVLVKTTEVPVRDALKQLSVDELMKIGCTVETTDDVVVIKPVDTDAEKAVKALLKTLTAEAAKESEPS